MAYQRTEETIPTFEIDTRNTCIFCLRPGSSENSNGTHGAGESCRDSVGGTALKLLFRYLKIDVLQLSHQNDAERVEAEVEATLCVECQEATADFRRFLNEMEAVRLKLSKSLVTISGRIQGGNEDTGRRKRFQETMRKTKNLFELMHAENLVDNLRRSTLEKCLVVVEASTPLVILNKNDVGVILRTLTDYDASSPSTSRNNRNGNPDFDLPVMSRTPESSRTEESVMKHNRYDECRMRFSSSASNGSVEEYELFDESGVTEVSINDEVETADNSPKELPSTSRRQAASPVTQLTTFTPPRSMATPQRNRAEIKSPQRMFGEGAFKCDVCGSKLKSKVTLKRHMVIHSSVKPFPCQLCPKAFNRITSLNDHVRTHTNERPHTCEVCKKTFSRRSTFSLHMRYGHSETRTFECPFCSKAFNFKANLENHIRIHTNEKPFSCGVCGAAFVHCKQLSRHKIAKHKKN